MCGLAELLLPPPWPVQLSTSPVPEQDGAQRQHAGVDHIESHSPHPISAGKAGPAGAAPGQSAAPDADPAGRGAQEAQETSSGASQGGQPGGSPGTDQLPALADRAASVPTQHFVIHVSTGSSSTLKEILWNAYQVAAGGTAGEARSILVSLQSMQPPAFVENTADPLTEQTARLELTPSRSILYSFENGATIPSFIANLASYAESVDEAKAWIGEAAVVWQNLIDTSGHRGRRSTHAEPNRTGPGQPTDGGGERIFVYCDVIQTSPCSDTQTRCMRIVPARRDKREFIFFPVYYTPVSQREVQFLHVELRDKRGDAVNFMPSHHPTVVILHFRRLY